MYRPSTTCASNYATFAATRSTTTVRCARCDARALTPSISTEPENPPRVWIHPCRCALIAHEACLLDWIQSSQTRSEVAAKNATKCPQCGTPYQIESRNPLILRLLSWGNRQMPKLGVACLAIGFVGLVASVTAGIYITCTSYGAYAIKVFFGQE